MPPIFVPGPFFISLTRKASFQSGWLRHKLIVLYGRTRVNLPRLFLYKSCCSCFGASINPAKMESFIVNDVSLGLLTFYFFIMGLIISILIGCLAGFLAGKIMKGGGFGFWINLLVGVVGGFLGGNILSWIGISWGGTVIGSLVTAVIGAVVLLWIISLFKK